MLSEFLTPEVLDRVAAAAAPDQPELRATLSGSQIIGLTMARCIVRLPHAVGTDRSPRSLHRTNDPVLLTGALPPGNSRRPLNTGHQLRRRPVLL